MNERRSHKTTSRGWALLLLVAPIGFGLFGTTPAEASPIRKAANQARIARRVQREVAFWESYYAQALRERRTTNVVVPRALKGLLPGDDAFLADSSYFRYLSWRRSLNPAQFDRNHPRLGPALVPAVVTPTPVVPPERPPSVSPSTTIPPQVRPEVPEPSSLIVALGLSAAGLFARRWCSRDSERSTH